MVVERMMMMMMMIQLFSIVDVAVAAIKYFPV